MAKAQLVRITFRVPRETRRLILAEAKRQARSMQFIVERELTRYARETEHMRHGELATETPADG